MQPLPRRVRWIVALSVVFWLLLTVEASVGHDGLLCELGYDSDGAGRRTPTVRNCATDVRSCHWSVLVEQADI